MKLLIVSLLVGIVHGNVLFRHLFSDQNQCVNLPRKAKSDVQTTDLYRNIRTISSLHKSSLQPSSKLNDEIPDVIVIPHSHDDAGWLNTFDGYVNNVNRVLNNVNTFLLQNDRMRFVQVEVSFFEEWWSRQSNADRQKFLKLLNTKHIEFVTGGWVMPDEANTHYFALISQLFEGHEFLKNHIKPDLKTHWSIDPFGLSPTVPYLMKLAGINNTVINRVHYRIKEDFKNHQEMEFHWRQHYAGDSDETDSFTHMTSAHYNAQSCGPDWSVCSRLDTHANLKDVPKTDAAVADLAKAVANQFWQKSKLFRHNTIFMFEGDDFRYQAWDEWRVVNGTFNKLEDYYKSHPEHKINLRLGTLDDYFTALKNKVARDPEVKFPTVSGDFFVYADGPKSYWSGYFTSRPFHKHLDRILQQYLRAAEIIYTMVNWKATQENFVNSLNYDALVDARRQLAIFQHHDAVTGTSKQFVMEDYEQRLQRALKATQQVVIDGMKKFIGENGNNIDVLISETFESRHESVQKVIDKDHNTVTIFNSLSHKRTEVVCFRTSTRNAKVVKIDGSEVPQQVSINFEANGSGDLVPKQFNLCFEAELPPLGFASYKVVGVTNNANFVEAVTCEKEFEEEIILDNLITIQNGLVGAKFDSKTGYLKYLSPDAKDYVEARFDYLSYYAGANDGAYTFQPEGFERSVPDNSNRYIVINGPVRKTIIVQGPKDLRILLKFYLDKGSKSFKVENWVNLQDHNDYELGMLISFNKTEWEKTEEFYTENNGFTTTIRHRLQDLHVGGSIFPMNNAAVIQKDGLRFSVFGRQPRGVASLRPGQLQIMLDRRINRGGDHKGMDDPIVDGYYNLNEFQFFLEKTDYKKVDQKEEPTVLFHSLEASQISRRLLHQPIITYHQEVSNLKSSHSFIKQELPCDVQIVNLRTLNEPTDYSHGRSTKSQKKAALILHRIPIDCNQPIPPQCSLSDGVVNVNSLFSSSPRAVHPASLTAYTVESRSQPDVDLKPMGLKTVILDF